LQITKAVEIALKAVSPAVVIARWNLNRAARVLAGFRGNMHPTALESANY
jgi:hypothetical protein